MSQVLVASQHSNVLSFEVFELSYLSMNLNPNRLIGHEMIIFHRNNCTLLIINPDRVKVIMGYMKTIEKLFLF
jgi:hypothetical protein